MPQPVCTVGHMFKGKCSTCNKEVTGYMTSGEFPQIEGKNICVTGSAGKGSCGHSCTAVGQSQVLFIEGKPVARVGDPVTGVIKGSLTTGSDFVTSD